ncbi:MAG: acetyl-CoA carboxylase biotin carboxylase subunit [Vicinamibacteria bacterium]|nr:acetyl-CoA carboxylase biotin carboxylase subunit [Vicinamibacteria bacterium]
MSTPRKFSKVLIANRGEIAVRVMRACRELGIRTVAVYSDADRVALHVRYADEAYFIGPSPSSESYLRMDKILEVAKRSGAEAIHPGYGFLSENATFARVCRDAGVVFIGPPEEAITAMGEKTAARRVAVAAGVPVVPGALHVLADHAAILGEATRIGYPLMLKAAAGGGGKGLRLVHKPEELEASVQRARSEAKSAFGDDSLYIERAILKPRHIEIQVLADTHGNAVHLFERECSIQRRHQKIIEESPSPFVTPELRERMGSLAVALVKKVGYVNAGTLEFLVDENREPYFLEMNTRLQVEHPITEMVTGVDLVKMQIRIAQGEALPFAQKDLTQRGHAIECRVCAEDPETNFIPNPGRIESLRVPGGPGVRDDSGVYEGFEVSMFYDPMISKLVVHAETREAAIARMLRAVSEYEVTGIKTTLPFFDRALRDRRFIEGDFDTGFVSRLQAEKDERVRPTEIAMAVAAVVAYRARRRTPVASGSETSSSSLWWRLGHRDSVTRL